MAVQGAAQPADNANAADGQQQQGGGMLQGILRMALMYYAFNYFMKGSSPTPSASSISSASGSASGSSSANFDATSGRVALGPHRNLWRDGQAFDLSVYVSPFTDFDQVDVQQDLKWHETGLHYNWNEDNNRSINITLPVTEHILNNGSLYAHVLFHIPTFPIDAHHPNFDARAVIHHLQQLNTFKPKPKVNVKKNLLSGEYVDERVIKELNAADGKLESTASETTTTESTSTSVATKSEQELLAELKNAPVEYVSFWKPSLVLHLIHDFTVFPRGQIPPTIAEVLKFDAASNDYYPVVYPDYFWSFSEHFLRINDTLTSLPLELSYSTMGMWKWQLQSQMEASWKMQESWGASNEGESEEFRRILAETNPWLLGLTAVVSILHSLFDFLAFKNDINFWKENQSVQGISVRTIFINCFCQFVIFLYLFDNETNWMIIISSGVGLLIECWKIKKAADVTTLNHFPYISIKDKASYTQTRTAEYDRQAMVYLSYALYPLAIGYAIYSLMYQEHKSWYSWLLSSMVSFIYMFGFILMCPQLYLNYKLKSVAHLPWRMLCYKFFNTIIDDVFSFIIKMPALHRLSCFRDDVIFLIYLYQRWIYPVDFKRENEFGLVPDVPEEVEDKSKDGKTKSEPSSTESSSSSTESSSVQEESDENADADQKKEK